MFTYERIQTLNESELEVYNHILSLESKVLDMKIRELAEACHVSVTVVWNFVKKMQCDGWTEFKIKYKESLLDNRSDEPLADDATIEYIESFNEDITQKMQVNKAALMVSKARKVVFIGEGTSGVMAKYGSMYLTSMGKSSQYTDTPFYPIPPEDHSDAVVIGLSVSGDTVGLLDRLARYKELGAQIITITNGIKNKLVSVSDLPLAYKVPKEEYHVMGPRKMLIRINTTTQMPVMYLIESIAKKYLELRRNDE
ncbi:MAG: MurR/RpiR family transcriptional regulator [Turicibacter sp.]|nr:MurR/RpiR family transcriptional regulator [Turicibacter sp.]